MKQEFSFIEIFGELPVSPDKFATLDPKLKWLGKAREGDSWCVTCGTLTPHIPRSHHSDCCSHQDTDEYEKYINPIGDCPECESDSLGIDSSRELMQSVITCGDCGYQYSGSVPEETLIEKFRAGRR